MSPRHFSKLMENHVYNKEVAKIVADQPNLWYAFTAITGIAKLFSYTPPVIVNKLVNDKNNPSEGSQG